MSLGSILSIARSGLHYQQVVMQTAGHNIANAEVEGYTRQRAEAVAGYPQQFSYGVVGTGVFTNDVSRGREALLDVAYRSESSGHAAASLRERLLSGIEGVLGEPSEDGLSAAIDALWSSWSDLAGTPNSSAARSVVQQRARSVAGMFNGFDARLSAMREQTQLQLESAVTEVNALSREIAQLNGRIVEFEVGGRTAGDLRDQRDLAVDRLSRLGEVRVLSGQDGSSTVIFGNTTVADGIHDTPLRLVTVPGTTRLALATAAHPSETILPAGGTTGTMLEFLNSELADAQQRLDALANGLARAVNLLHERGNDGTAGAPYLSFFVDKTSPTGKALPDQPIDPLAPRNDAFTRPLVEGTVTARTIALHADLESDASRIATTSSRVARPADNDIALAMATLRTGTSVMLGTVNLGAIEFTLPDPSTRTPDDRITIGSTSIADFYRSSTSSLGTQVRDAATAATVRGTLLEQSEQRREASNGVSVDEELTTLMRAQQAYAAAAKVISTVDEMMDALLGMV